MPRPGRWAAEGPPPPAQHVNAFRIDLVVTQDEQRARQRPAVTTIRRDRRPIGVDFGDDREPGQHLRSDEEAGPALGEQVADYVASHLSR